MNNLNPLEHPQDKANIYKLLEEHGYTDIKKADVISSSNKLFTAIKDDINCIIKVYADNDGRSGKISSKSDREMLCYENLPKDITLNVVEVNRQDRYLATEIADLEKVEKTEENLLALIDWYYEKVATIDGSFLPEMEWNYYESTLKKLPHLEELGIINNSEKITKLFEESKELFANCPKSFIHTDFNLVNIKKNKGEFIIYDFEYSRNDTPLLDMATLYIDFYDDEHLRKVFEDRIKQTPNYDEELFKLMLLQRSILVMNHFYNTSTVDYFEKNKKVFEDISAKF